MKHSGFTLIEILVALSLFTVGMVSVLQIFPINRKFLVQSADTTQAVFLAQEEMEIVRNTSYASLTTGAAQAFEPLHTLSVSSGPFVNYRRTTVINFVDPAAAYLASATDKFMKRVDITVTWDENGNTRTYTLSSVVVKR